MPDKSRDNANQDPFFADRPAGVSGATHKCRFFSAPTLAAASVGQGRRQDETVKDDDPDDHFGDGNPHSLGELDLG